MHPPSTKYEKTDSVGSIFDGTWEAPVDTHYRWHVKRRKKHELKTLTENVVDGTCETSLPLRHEENTRYVDSKYPTFCSVVDSIVPKTWDELYVSAPEILEKHQALIRQEVPQRAKQCSKMNSVQNQGIDGDMLTSLFFCLPHQSNKNFNRKGTEFSEEDDTKTTRIDSRTNAKSFQTPSGTCGGDKDDEFCSTSGVEVHISPETNKASECAKRIISPSFISSDHHHPLNMNFPHPIHLFNCRFISTILSPMCIQIETMWWWDKHGWMENLVAIAGRLALSQQKGRKIVAKKMPRNAK